MRRIRNLLREMAARLGFWIPCSKYMPPRKYWDWVLISYREPPLPYYYVPTVAEYSYERKKWHELSDMDSEEFINNRCVVTHWHRLPRELKVKEDV